MGRSQSGPQIMSQYKSKAFNWYVFQNPEEQPEYPVISRKYMVQFMYVEDKSTNAEIFQILHDDQLSTRSPSTRPTQVCTARVTVHHVGQVGQKARREWVT